MSAAKDTPQARGWIVVALCFVALAFTFAGRSTVSIVIPIWEAEMGWPRALSATGSSLVLAMMAIGSPIAGNLMDRYGTRPVMTAGLAALAAGIAATSFATEPMHYLLAFGIVGGCGWAAISIPLATAAVARYFERHRGLAIGVAISGSTGGQLPVLSLIAAMIAAIGWRDTFLVVGVLMAALALLVRAGFGKAGVGPSRPSGGTWHADSSLAARLRLLFANRTFVLLLAAFTLCGFTTAGVIDVHFIPYAITCGYTQIQSASAFGVHGVGNLVGMVLVSWLADHVHRPRLLAAMFFLRALSFVLLLYIAHDVRLMYVFTAVFGFLNFATFPVIANIVFTHIGAGVLGLTLGLLYGGHSLGAAVGAVLGGWIFDLLARYEWVWWLSGALAALAGVLAIMIRETRNPTAAPAPAAA